MSAGPAGGPLSAGRLSAAGSSRCCHLSYRSDRTGSVAGPQAACAAENVGSGSGREKFGSAMYQLF